MFKKIVLGKYNNERPLHRLVVDGRKALNEKQSRYWNKLAEYTAQ